MPKSLIRPWLWYSCKLSCLFCSTLVCRYVNVVDYCSSVTKTNVSGHQISCNFVLRWYQPLAECQQANRWGQRHSPFEHSVTASTLCFVRLVCCFSCCLQNTQPLLPQFPPVTTRRKRERMQERRNQYNKEISLNRIYPPFLVTIFLGTLCVLVQSRPGRGGEFTRCWLELLTPPWSAQVGYPPQPYPIEDTKDEREEGEISEARKVVQPSRWFEI